MAAANGLRKADSAGANVRANSMAPLVPASGPTDGVTPPSTATAATRRASGGRSGACQCVWAAAGEADDAEPLGTEGVHHVGHVGGPVGHLLVGVRVGQARSRSLHQHDAQAELLSSAAPDERELTPATRRAVEPENDRPGRVAELGVAQPPTAGEEEAPFRARLFAAGDAGRVPPGVGRAHNLGSSRPVRGIGDPPTA